MIHHVFANKSNIGDWLSALGIQALLAPRPVTEHFCDAPFVAETLDRLRQAGSGDLIVVGGGGLFMDYFAPLWEGLVDIADRVPLCIWGVGFCDLKLEPSRCDRRLLESVIRKARRCVVRDELTRDLFAACGLPAAIPCPSLCYIDPQPMVGGRLLHVDNYTTVGPAAYDVMDRTGRAWARRTNRTFKRTNNRIEPGSRRELERVLDLYRGAEIVLSSALHGCIVGAAMGRRIVAVSGDRKIEGFMSQVGLSDWVLDAADVSSVEVLLESIQEQPDVASAIQFARSANRAFADRLLALLDR